MSLNFLLPTSWSMATCQVKLPCLGKQAAQILTVLDALMTGN